MDNDEDSKTDCADPSCHNHPDVTVCVETNCSDGMDDDMDGRIDCEDFDCLKAQDANCMDNPNDGVEAGPMECSNLSGGTDPIADAVDDDGDMKANCADSSCKASVPSCTETMCEDGVDNNSNGFADCADFDCSRSDATGALCGTQGPGYEGNSTTCADGVSNDGNNFVDCDDFACSKNNALGTLCAGVSEGNTHTCSDGLDNDNNGFTDCSDFACRKCDGANPYSVGTCDPCI